MARKIKLYTDTNSEYIKHPESSPYTESLSYILYPLVDELGIDLQSTPNEKTFLIEGKNYFSLSSLEDCDYVVPPIDWYGNQNAAAGKDERVLQLAKIAEKAGKKLLVFFKFDPTNPLPISNAIVFRSSLLKSKKQNNEIAMPGFNLYYIPNRGPMPLRSKSRKPSVGFCGFVGGGYSGSIKNPIERKIKAVREHFLVSNIKINRFLRKMGVRISRNRGYEIRAQIIRLLKDSKAIQTNFILRDRFYLGDGNEAEVYLKNMEESDYILCPRGSGNFSYRFYETLSFGRIPIFINTDCCLPYEDYINWKDYCVWVEEDELENLEDKILEFHERLDEEAFREKQKECHELWKKWLSLDGFFSNIHRYLMPVSQ